eukprot:15476177-Alexandrium_andersonii.AAC.1
MPSVRQSVRPSGAKRGQAEPSEVKRGQTVQAGAGRDEAGRGRDRPSAYEHLVEGGCISDSVGAPAA